MYARASGKPPIDLDVPPAPTKRDRAVRNAVSEPLEKEIQKIVLRAVRAHPKVAWCGRINSGTAVAQNRDGTARFTRFNTIAGIADLIGQLKDGRFMAWEIKRNANSPITEQQMQFLNTVTVYRGVCGVVWSVEMALEILDRA